MTQSCEKTPISQEIFHNLTELKCQHSLPITVFCVNIYLWDLKNNWGAEAKTENTIKFFIHKHLSIFKQTLATTLNGDHIYMANDAHLVEQILYSVASDYFHELH